MEKEYRLLAKWKLFHGVYALIFGTLAITIFLLLFSKDSTFFNKIVAAPLFVIISVAFGVRELNRAFKEHVRISPRGIEYQSFDYVLFSDWQSLNRTGSNREYFMEVDGIFADRASSEIKKWNLGSIKHEIFIPLSIFANNWRDSELGQQIKQYAPHLSK